MPDRKHILVADDDLQIVAAYRVLFESLGLRVSSASNGSDAQKLLATMRFDAIVTDLSMPNCGGVELIAEARRRADTPPIIVVTGDSDAEHRLTGFDNVQILHKPANAACVLGALGDVL
ncbi:response regulator [Azospirillum agricola]|uniref:response regulator n=1 Tax=Azospirillum agricola TaxID=1720247 RepID=UPI000A0F3939|nr:response regulator [Azospirillum agricola]SMH43254.1 Response regulator receiver domain-containing protein [Azospirillum lipoferum]